MASITTSLNTPFTPTKTVFRVQVNGSAMLVSKNSSGVAQFAPVLDENMRPVIIEGVIEVSNNPTGPVYMLVPQSNGTTIAVDE